MYVCEKRKLLSEWRRKKERDLKWGIKGAEFCQCQVKYIKYVLCIALNTMSVYPYLFKTLKIFFICASLSIIHNLQCVPSELALPFGFGLSHQEPCFG